MTVIYFLNTHVLIINLKIFLSGGSKGRERVHIVFFVAVFFGLTEPMVKKEFVKRKLFH